MTNTYIIEQTQGEALKNSFALKYILYPFYDFIQTLKRLHTSMTEYFNRWQIKLNRHPFNPSRLNNSKTPCSVWYSA